MAEPDYVAINREGWTRANAEYTDANAREAWGQKEVTWGKWSLPESEVRGLPDVAGKDVVELGCGTGYFGAWLKRAGASRVVGVDVTPAQLETAGRMNEEFGLGLEFLLENAERTSLPGESFDLVFSEYGASIWCDPKLWLAEAARLLRAGGRCGVEHDDTTSARAVEAFTRTGRFVDVTARHDLTGRPRFVTAVRERLTS